MNARRLWSTSRARLIAVICGGVLIALITTSPAATFLDFPSPQDIADNRVYAWQTGSAFLMEDPAEGPMLFTYAVGPGFLSNEGPDLPPSAARQIVANMLYSWTTASHGYFNFVPSSWQAVMNDGPAPPDQWEGPSIEEWLASDTPENYPGWGANFEFFSVPTGFTINSQGVPYQMFPNSLGFTVANRMGSTHIVSVDIYLNEDFSWFGSSLTPDSDDDESSATNQFDLSTVLLHEMGHALGLDHPNQAVANSSLNISPYTYQPNDAWSTDDLMYSTYQGVRDHPTIDEVGGAAYLYGLPSPLDVNGDGVLSGADIGVILVNWNLQGLGRPGDINYDGVVDTFDLSLFLVNFDDKGDPVEAPFHDQLFSLDDLFETTVVGPLIFDCYHVPINETGIEENELEYTNFD